MNFSSSVMSGMGISLGSLEMVTDFLYANSDMYEPELTEIKTTISHKPCKPVTRVKPVKPKISTQNIISKFSLVPTANKQSITSCDEVIDDTSLMLTQDDDFDVSFDDMKTDEEVAKEVQEENAAMANDLLSRLQQVNTPKPQQEAVVNEEDTDDDFEFEDEEESDSIEFEDDTDDIDLDISEDDIYGDEEDEYEDEEDEEDDDIDLEKLAEISNKKLEEQKALQAKILQEQQQKQQQQQQQQQQQVELDSEDEEDDYEFEDEESEENEDDFDFDIDDPEDEEDDYELEEENEEEFEFEDEEDEQPAVQQKPQQTQSVEVQPITTNVQQNQQPQAPDPSLDKINQLESYIKSLESKIETLVAQTAQNNKPAEAPKQEQVKQVKTEVPKNKSVKTKEQASSVKKKDIKKDSSLNVPKSKPAEEVEVPKKDPKLERYEHYASMQIEKLYKEVRETAIKLGVEHNLVDITELNDKFGAINIKKLIDKSYIIKIGKGVTIGR